VNRAARALLAAAATGLAGWALENVVFGARYSHLLPGVPLLPIYAVGGAAISLAEPALRPVPTVGRALVYAGGLAALEASAGAIERAKGRTSWDYDGSPADVPHAFVWGLLGLVAEAMVRRL